MQAQAAHEEKVKALEVHVEIGARVTKKKVTELGAAPVTQESLQTVVDSLNKGLE